MSDTLVVAPARPIALALTLSLCACAPTHARRTTRYAEYAIGGSLAGIILGSLIIGAVPDHKPVGIAIAATFGGLAIVSAIVYGVAYASIPPDGPPPAPPDHRPEAWELTKRAQAAARAGDCATVRELSPQIRDLDAGVHGVVFMRDAAVEKCMFAPPGSVPSPDPMLAPPGSVQPTRQP
jgi:hypothetical protein